MTPTPCYTAADDLGQLPRFVMPSSPLVHQTPTEQCAALTNLFPHLVGWGCEGCEAGGVFYLG